ncbi:MAG TPA: PIN domain-containing protein [Acidobacteriaceae bacterium]|nr:PIN domain-containing protein [Acidobacteriaceae bacterium]
MILVDTSIWIDHFHRPDRELASLLRYGLVLIHPFVLGELALGSSPDRAALMNDLAGLRGARVASDTEVLRLIEDWALSGAGIGYMDAHLLASVLLTSGSRLWTRDRVLRKVARQLSLDAELR